MVMILPSDSACEIVTLTVNPAIDISTSVPHITPYHKLRCAEARRDPGGGGINVARVLGRFGAPAKAIYSAGGVTGQLLRQLVRRADIESIAVPIRGDTREDFTVSEGESGHQFRFVLPGPSMVAEECEALLEAVENCNPQPRMIVVSGSLPTGVPVDFLARVTKINR
jgi:6-phosphofructokinase 2